MGSFYDKFLETRGEKTSLDAVEFNTGHLGEKHTHTHPIAAE